MRVMWVSSESYPRIGGLEKYVALTLSRLSDSVNVGLVTNEGQFPEPESSIAHLGTMNLDRPTSVGERRANGLRLKRIAMRFKADIIHLASAGLASYASFLNGIAPVFVTVHCKDLTRPWQLTPGLAQMEALSEGLMLCERVFCVSRYTEEKVLFVAPHARTHLLAPGIEPSALISQKMISTSRPVPSILTVARFVDRKNHLGLLRCLEKVQVPFIWHIVGDGPSMPTFLSRLATSSIKKQVVVHGHLEAAQLNTIFASCDLFALLPIEIEDEEGLDAEGFGIVYIEAGFFGLPSLASTKGGCPDAVQDCVTGLLRDPDDDAATIQAICKLLTDSGFRHRLGEAARARVLLDFLNGDRVAELLTFYQAAVSCSTRRTLIKVGG